MKLDAFGNINFKNITEDDMQEIESTCLIVISSRMQIMMVN